MADQMGSIRVVDRLLGDDSGNGDLMVVDEVLRGLLDGVDRLADAPAPAFLAALVAAVPSPARPARRGLRIVVASGAVLLGAAGSAAAATGSLPDPVQAAVHAVAGTVGINVPDGDAQGPPTSGGSQDGEGHGRSDEAPGRPEDPGQPADPYRSDEAPGQPEDPGSSGVGSDGVTPGEVDDPGATEPENENAGEGDGNSDDGLGNANPSADEGDDNADPNAVEGGDNADEGAGNGDTGQTRAPA